MRRAATPLRYTNTNGNQIYNVQEDGEDGVPQDVVIPIMVSELTAPCETLDLETHNGNKHEECGTQVSACVSSEEIKDGMNGNKVASRERRKSDSNDTSWAKIKKKTSPVVNASVVFTYLVLSTMFVFGWVSLNSCTVNPFIPVYLIVAGSTGILTKALIRTRNKYLFNVVILLVLFDLCWQAFGSYIVYREYQPNYDPTMGVPYCHRVSYLLAFWIITLVYSLIGLFILLSSCYFLMRNTFRKE